MELTTLQKERIAYHLKMVRTRHLLQISRDNILLTGTDSQFLAMVGQPLEDLAEDEIFVFESQPLCSRTSMLGRVEKAFANLSPDVIEDSLFVSQAGTAFLRGNELKKREELYNYLVTKLNDLLGDCPSETRVGW